jgi:hypothetical protein
LGLDCQYLFQISSHFFDCPLFSYGSLQATIKQGLEQTYTYMDKCGAKEGYLLIFNPSTKKPWREKLFKKTGTFKDVKINIYGM